MSGLLLPADAAAEEVNAALAEIARCDTELAVHWTAELKRIDPSLSVEWVPEQAVEFDNPGRWHVRKQIPGDFDEWWPLLGENGAYREPGSWLLEALTASDMWNPRVHRDKQEARERHRQAKVRAREREAEQRQDEMALANRAARRLRGDSGMTKRTDLLVPKAIAEERRRKKAEEEAAAKETDAEKAA